MAENHFLLFTGCVLIFVFLFLKHILALGYMTPFSFLIFRIKNNLWKAGEGRPESRRAWLLITWVGSHREKKLFRKSRKPKPVSVIHFECKSLVIHGMYI